MTKETLIQEARKLPAEEQREVGEHFLVLNTKDGGDPRSGLTRDQLAQLEKTYKKHLRNPEQGRPAEEVLSEIKRSLR